MPDFAEAQTSSAGSRESAPSSDVDARAAKPGRLNLRALLIVLAIASAVKLAVFGMTVATSMSLSLPNAESWQDFTLAYVPAVEAFKNGFLPYRDFFYPYPPLFLWTLTASSPFPYASWVSGLPLVGADALTAIPVYLIAKQLTSEHVSWWVTMLFIFAPTNLYYADYLLLNPPLTTLFLLTSVYLMLRGRYGWSALALGLSIGLKQTALFALPVILLIVWKRAERKVEPFRYLLLVSAVCLAFSLPYLVVAPTLYLDSIFRLPLNTFANSYFPPGYYNLGVGSGTQVTFDTSNWLTSRWILLSNGVYSPVTLALPFFIFLAPPALFGLYSSLLLSGSMAFIIVIVFALLLRSVWKRAQPDTRACLDFVLYGMLVVFTFYPFYKYYIVGVMPFLVLLVRSRRGAAGFLAFSFALMLIPRYFASWFLLGSLVWLLRQDFELPLLGVEASTQPATTPPKEYGTKAAPISIDEAPPTRPDGFDSSTHTGNPPTLPPTLNPRKGKAPSTCWSRIRDWSTEYTRRACPNSGVPSRNWGRNSPVLARRKQIGPN